MSQPVYTPQTHHPSPPPFLSPQQPPQPRPRLSHRTLPPLPLPSPSFKETPHTMLPPQNRLPRQRGMRPRRRRDHHHIHLRVRHRLRTRPVRPDTGMVIARIVGRRRRPLHDAVQAQRGSREDQRDVEGFGGGAVADKGDVWGWGHG